MFVHDEIARDDFLHTVNGHRINPRQIDQRDFVLLNLKGTFFFLNRNARPVADMLLGTGQPVKQRRFSGIGIACEGDFKVHQPTLLTSIVLASSLRSDNS